MSRATMSRGVRWSEADNWVIFDVRQAFKVLPFKATYIDQHFL